MKMGTLFSRRIVLGSLVASGTSTIAPRLADTQIADSHLIASGRKFEQLTVRFDQIVAGECDFDDSFIAEFDRIESEIIASHATTIEGLRVKARAACWALLGDIDPVGEPTTNRRMALSIVRDLIRLGDPSLEQPRAMKKLVQKIEADAMEAIAAAS